jgi:hypothetical protein
MLLARGKSGDIQRALALIRTALQTYRELDMEHWARRALEFERVLRVASATG